MKKVLLSAMACAALFASCNKKSVMPERTNDVVVNLIPSGISDLVVKSAASDAENLVSSVTILGVDANGYVAKTFTVDVTSPTVTLSLPNEVETLYAIVNMDSDIIAANLDQIKDLTFDAEKMPTSPFVMSGEAAVKDSSIDVELYRSTAKVTVEGNKGLTIESISVINTPSKGYVYANTNAIVPTSALKLDYTTIDGNIAYITENENSEGTKFAIKGSYEGKTVTYTVSLGQDIVRNTNYQVTISPITDTDCSVDVTIPEWNDENVGEVVVPIFGDYYSVDFHQHTAFSDGMHPIQFVLNQAAKYGIDITVNSEHGGGFSGNASEGDQEVSCPTWIESGLTSEDIIGDVNGSGDGQKMWRWQSIRDYSFPQIVKFNSQSNANNTLAVQGLEWNPPGHEHCSVATFAGQFAKENASAAAMAQFEYMFDNNDKDVTGGEAQGWEKCTLEGHDKTMAAAKWLQDNHRYTSWMVPAHPERKNLWQIDAYRDLNDIAPDVFVAFESIPGHQASTSRGGYGNSASYGKTYTYGGSGLQSVKIGGLWDALLSEGRRFWLVANSDYHKHSMIGGSDFYPGEYQKTYISMKEQTAQGFADGIRSGNLFTVHGDLIDKLEFSIGGATMGQTLNTEEGNVVVRILVNDPQSNNFNVYSDMTNPELNHIDLIAGEMRSKVAKGSAEYSVDSYDKVKVVARFDAEGNIVDGNGIVSSKWEDLGNGQKLVEYTFNVDKDTYFRLRGTNNALNVVGQTDENGNPLIDMPSASAEDARKEAFEDLWFYSSPVYVRVK